ncbi:MAG: hypothetical protein ACRCYC_15430 [Paraclostridium sp.]|uniref:hypothetical protein n=1 Tax=Paraclostridium sp. TaxID=2023273 RepID=UPI003F33755B
MNDKNFSAKSKLLVEFLICIVVFISTFAGFKNFSNIQYFWPIMYLILIGCIFLLSNKLGGIVDELSQLILSKINNICIKILVSFILIMVSFLSTPYINVYSINSNVIGMILSLFLLLLSLVRLVLFIYFDRKGICQ